MMPSVEPPIFIIGCLRCFGRIGLHSKAEWHEGYATLYIPQSERLLYQLWAREHFGPMTIVGVTI